MIDPKELDPFSRKPDALAMTETSFELLRELAAEYGEKAVQYMKAVIEVLGAMGSVLTEWGGESLLVGRADDDRGTIELYDMADVIRVIRGNSQGTSMLSEITGMSQPLAHTLSFSGDDETGYIEVLALSLEANIPEVVTMGVDLRKAMLDAQAEGLIFAISVDGETWVEIIAESAADID